MTIRIRMLISLGVLSAILAVSAGSASAETPSGWFHLGSVSRPGYLPSGLAKDEVQEIAVSPGVLFLLRVHGHAQPLGDFASEPFTFKFVPEATAVHVQAALETVYGAGNVEVTGGVKAPGGPAEALKITTVKEKADRTVEPVEVEAFFGTTATASVVTQGQPDGYIAATAVNVGEADVDGSTTPVRIVDTLPQGVAALFVEANTRNSIGNEHGVIVCTIPSPRVVECTFGGKLPPYQQIELVIAVAVQEGTKSSVQSGEDNEVSVSGGGAPSARLAHPIVVSNAPTPFGVETYELSPEEPGGVADTQAGSHPFQLTTTFNLNETLEANPAHVGDAVPAVIAKDLTFKLPPGLIGNPTSYQRCSLAQFNTFPPTRLAVETNECPAGSVVGVASVTYTLTAKLGGMQTATLPLYNLEPAYGEPARFGFQPAKVPVLLDTSIRTGGDYGVTVHIENITQLVGFLSNTVTFWGVPGDQRHNALRGPDCLAEIAEDLSAHAPCQPLEEAHPAPLLSLPTSCSGSPLETAVFADSWAEPDNPVPPSPNPSVEMPSMVGCGLLPFASEIKVTPDIQAGSTPSGLKVDVHVPQTEAAVNGNGLAPAMLKNILVTLPEGLQLNPSSADGLQACSEEQVGFKGENPVTHTLEFTNGEVSCPDASKIANVTIKSPLLPLGQYLHGFVYLASPQNFAGPAQNPFSRHVALYLVAKDPISGTLVKLPGSVELGGEENLDPSLPPLKPGQIRSSFANNPQLPFEDAEIEFFGGERAPLATPALCRLANEEGYVTHAIFEPWTNTPAHREALASESEFDILTGPNGTPCANPLPFNASLSSQSTNVNSGTFTPLSTTISRPSGDQNLQSVTLHYPPGLSGMLTGVALCPEAQANAGTCGEGSLIGETIVSVGVGGDPFTVTGGKVYITEKYAGAPFGLSIVNPAKAGPFILQQGRPIVVRAKIEIDPITSALTIVTDASGAHAIPTMVEGFALQIQHVNVTINRPGFTFNPTNCNPTKIEGAINSAEGATSPVSVPFQVTNCAVLGFKPKFSVSTSGKTSRKNGASLHVKLAYPKAAFGSQANIRSVKVNLPKQLPSRLTTLQKACSDATFNANPAACPAASRVGTAKATTPLIPVPLTGPAYFVSHGGAKFPELIVVLSGYGVTLDLHGETFISKAGITSSTFGTIPDAPVGSFELNLPEGPYSALAANGELCTSTLAMPTAFTAQNGLVIKQNTPITVSGCKPAIRVVGHSVTGSHASIRVTIPSAGTLVATGAEIERSVKRVAKTGTVTIGVALTGQGLRVLAKNPHQRVNANVKLRFTPKHGAPLTAYVRLLMG